MRIRPLEAADVAAVAPALAGLPLMLRYGRGATALERALASALARGDRLLLADDHPVFLRGLVATFDDVPDGQGCAAWSIGYLKGIREGTQA